MGNSNFWTHKGIKLHYHQVGQGPPFFLIHGYSPSLNWQIWERTIPVLAADHTVFGFDMVGHGESTKIIPKPTSEEQADLLITLILETKLTDVSLAGVSWGGTICQLIASKIPERIKRLLLISSAGYRLPDEILNPTQKIPTLIIWSEDDAVIPLANGQALAKRLPIAKFVTIPPVEGVTAMEAHHPEWHKSNLTNPLIQSFIKETH